MTKGDLVESVAGKIGMSKTEAEAAVNATLAAIGGSLQNGEDVRLVGFGTFTVRNRKARTGRNPRTGEVIQIQASKTVGFKAGKALKESL
ncbi:MAG: HU family DNA-binding protein [Planctomycetes bacterium]|nr:HU family DNA-binding protein [Planctomycetota bacterium]